MSSPRSTSASSNRSSGPSSSLFTEETDLSLEERRGSDDETRGAKRKRETEEVAESQNSPSPTNDPDVMDVDLEENQESDIELEDLFEEPLEPPSEQSEQLSESEQALEQTPEQAPEQPTERAPEQSSFEEVFEKPLEQPYEQVSEQTSEQVSEEASGEASEPPSEQAFEQASLEELFEKPLEQPPEQPSEQGSEQESEQGLEQAPEQTSDETSEQASEEVPEQAPEQQFEQVPEQASEQAFEQGSEPESEEAPEEASEQASEQALERAPEQVPEQASEKAPEPAPKKSADKVEKKVKAKSTKPANGSPWDPTPRNILKVEDLDLDESYADDILEEPAPKRPKRQKRWRHREDIPLTDIDQLPKGWNADEPDLDKNDYDGQIERCYERIKDNILPDVFRQRLSEFVQAKAHRDAMMRRFPSGLSWEVVQRLASLERIKAHLEKIEDPDDEIENINAIMKQYKSGDLTWNRELVTYWSKGNQLCQPRLFDWDEFEAINAKHQGHKSFWVEGTLGPGPQSSRACIKVGGADIFRGLNSYECALRLPSLDPPTRWWAKLEMMHDTGASGMSLYTGDLETLAGPNRALLTAVPLVGWCEIADSHDKLHPVRVIEVEATVLDNKGNRMSNWVRAEAFLKDGDFVRDQSQRLDGPWLRNALYTATVPDGKHELYIASSSNELRLPKIAQSKTEATVTQGK